MLASPAITGAAPSCPPEVKEAKALLTAKTAAPAKATRPSKSQAAARGQDAQAPRGQDAQAPRGQDVQAPRTKDRPEPPTGPVPRGQQEIKDADTQRALANAQAAMALLKYVP
jgi:hypothetical protein